MQSSIVLLVTITLTLIWPFTAEGGAEKARPKAYQNKKTAQPKSSSKTLKQKFRCDGRIYCSQMSSCEEALFFIKHCPDTRMDGDRDGKPCERQFKGCGEIWSP